MDPFGLLPPSIRANAEREQMVDRHLQQAHSLATALNALDERLEVVFFSDRAEPIMGIVPGRWHVRRRNDRPEPDSYFPITTPEGGYREPDHGIVEELRQRDMWRHGTPDVEPKSTERDVAHTAEAIAHEVRAAKRVAGDGGLDKKRWAK